MKRLVLKKLTAVISCVPLIAVSPMALGGSVMGNGGATEVTQILNNAELAMQTMQDEIRNMTQIKQLAYETLQQLPLDVAEYKDMFAEASNHYREVSDAVTAAHKLYGSVNNFKEVLTHRMHLFSASNLSWKDYLQREMDYAQYRGEQTSFLTGAELQAAGAIEQAFKELAIHQQKIGRTSGTHAAVSVMSAQLQTLTTLTGVGISNLNQHYQAQTAAMQEEVGARKRAMQQADALRKAQDEANARTNARLGGGK
ncbi:MAG: hypothetical protein H6943_05040 [Zoogloeaceae bacterium]|nr:hypothetical protein [Zoogloeaceae bacterium]